MHLRVKCCVTGNGQLPRPQKPKECQTARCPQHDMVRDGCILVPHLPQLPQNRRGDGQALSSSLSSVPLGPLDTSQHVMQPVQHRGKRVTAALLDVEMPYSCQVGLDGPMLQALTGQGSYEPAQHHWIAGNPAAWQKARNLLEYVRFVDSVRPFRKYF